MFVSVPGRSNIQMLKTSHQPLFKKFLTFEIFFLLLDVQVWIEQLATLPPTTTRGTVISATVCNLYECRNRDEMNTEHRGLRPET